MANRKKYQDYPLHKFWRCNTCTRYMMIPDGQGYYYDACHNNSEYCRYVKQRPLKVSSSDRVKNLDEMRKNNEKARKDGIPF